MPDKNLTAATIRWLAPELLRETRDAHASLLHQQQAGKTTINLYTVVKQLGRVQFAISTDFISVDDKAVRRVLRSGHGHALVASSMPGEWLPRPVFEIVTRNGDAVKRRAGYRLWMGQDGDSALLADQPGRPAWRIEGNRLVRHRSAHLDEGQRRAGFARADRMIRRLAWAA
ncbi:hypothetical protein [Sphingomonas phyllosphaerae]|uniref:hypothetical protein n=1 Tax=Sphingomonas phyllosphaerae TaxID=257003 RepID=UPI000406AD83|nr:hypothetical protein [Sphingomonas phyllosphaerae]